MEPNPRPTSSVYSDPFELDSLLGQLMQAEAQDYHDAVQKRLQGELEAARQRRDAARSRFHAIYRLMISTADAAVNMSLLAVSIRNRLELEKNIWLANRTCF